jgi:hypothetical protein
MRWLIKNTWSTCHVTNPSSSVFIFTCLSSCIVRTSWAKVATGLVGYTPTFDDIWPAMHPGKFAIGCCCSFWLRLMSFPKTPSPPIPRHSLWPASRSDFHVVADKEWFGPFFPVSVEIGRIEMTQKRHNKPHYPSWIKFGACFQMFSGGLEVAKRDGTISSQHCRGYKDSKWHIFLSDMWWKSEGKL